MTHHIKTNRLHLRAFQHNDATFLVTLLQSPGWQKHIGQNTIDTPSKAITYMDEKLHPLEQAHGFGLWCVVLSASEIPVGMCGLVKRPWLDLVDLGFAIAPEHARRGYTIEAAQAVIHHAYNALALTQIGAITTMNNTPSQHLLERLQFTHQGDVTSPDHTTLMWYVHQKTVPNKS